RLTETTMQDRAELLAEVPPLLVPPRETRRVRPALLSLIFAFLGLARISGPFLSTSLLSVPMKWAGVVEGVFWLGLSSAVFRRNASATRKCVALILVAMSIGALIGVAAPPSSVDIPGAHTPTPLELVLFAAAFLVVGVGFWSAREWGRR